MSEERKWYRAYRRDGRWDVELLTPAEAVRWTFNGVVSRVVELVDGPEVKPPPPKDTFADVLNRWAPAYSGVQSFWALPSTSDMQWLLRVGRMVVPRSRSCLCETAPRERRQPEVVCSDNSGNARGSDLRGL